MKYGVFEVTENHTYRGHPSGALFEARLDRQAEHRAIGRGVIRLVDTLTPALVPNSFTFPRGWLAKPHQPPPEGAERRLSHGKE